MKRGANKWLVGCGIGCGGLFLLVIVIFGASFLYLRSTFKGIAVVAESQDALVRAGGELGDYVPPADGAVPADRMEVFLDVREALVEKRADMDVLFEEFPPEGVEEDSFLKLFVVLDSLAGMITPIGEYVATRNEALIEAGMGIGEYFYIYSLAYYSFLGHSPEDGPVITEGCCPGSGGERLFSDEDATFSGIKVRQRYRRHMLALLRNQLESLAGAPGAGDDGDARSLLQSALDRFESHPGSVAYAQGLPPAIEASLSPYRKSLERTYHAATNCFEVPMSKGEGSDGWSR